MQWPPPASPARRHRGWPGCAASGCSACWPPCCAFGSSSAPCVLDASTATLLPPPSAVVRGAWELIETGELWRHLRDSLKRELVAFSGRARRSRSASPWAGGRRVNEQVDPLVEVLRPDPAAGLDSAVDPVVRHRRHAEPVHHLPRHVLPDPAQHHRRREEHRAQPDPRGAAAWAPASGASCGAWCCAPPCRRSSPASASGWASAGWRWSRPSWSAPTPGSGFLINDARTVLRTDYVIVGMITIGIVGLLIDRCIRVLGGG